MLELLELYALGIFVMTLLNRSKDNLNLLQNNTDKDCNANVYK